jgi:hypothetical protein
MCYTKLREGSVQEMKEKNTDTLVNVYVYFCIDTHINVLQLLFVTVSNGDTLTTVGYIPYRCM